MLLKGGVVLGVYARPESKFNLCGEIVIAGIGIEQHGGHHAEIVRHSGSRLSHALPPTAWVKSVQLHNTATD